MNLLPPQLSKWRVADLTKIVQGPPLRELFLDLLSSLRGLPLAPYELAEFLRLVGYEEISKSKVSDADLPLLIAQLQRFLSKSTAELLEILGSLQAQEWPPVAPSHLGPELEASDSQKTPSAAPAFRLLSFNDPPRRRHPVSFVDQ